MKGPQRLTGSPDRTWQLSPRASVRIFPSGWVWWSHGPHGPGYENTIAGATMALLCWKVAASPSIQSLPYSIWFRNSDPVLQKSRSPLLYCKDKAWFSLIILLQDPNYFSGLRYAAVSIIVFLACFTFCFFFLGGKRVSSRKIRYSLGIISVLENIFFLNLEIQWLGVTWLLICYFYIITGWSVIRGKPLCKSWCWVRPFKSFFHILSFLNLSSYVNITTPCHHTYRVPLWYSKSHMRPTQAMEALPSRVYL